MLRATAILALVAHMTLTGTIRADVPLGGFIPLVGIGMTNEFKTIEEIDLGGIPFIADPSVAPGGPLLGVGGTPYFDLALLDTGAATHILTQDAFNGFDLLGNGMRGTNIQPVGGATGIIDLEINDAGGIYASGLGDRTAAGTQLGLASSKLRGQTSVATLTAPAEWTLPNILGLPMAAQHAIAIQNSDPQIFHHQGRTVRTPQVNFHDLGSGGGGIVRRAPLKLHPGIGFIQGPQYVFNLAFDSILSGGGIAIHDDPASPSVIIDTNGNGGGLYIEIDLTHGANALQDKEVLFDTGADLTVVSQITAARLGYDPVLDTPDFVLEVEGSGGVVSGIPGFYLDELNIDTVGGSFTVHNVPIAVLDVTNPNEPGNTIDGILGMHLFTGRDLVIDADASVGQGGAGPSLYISDPVTDSRSWASPAATENWSTSGNWSTAGVPTTMWDVNVSNVSGDPQVASLTENSTVFQLAVSGDTTDAMTVDILAGTTLTTFGETKIADGGRVQLHGSGAKVDAQFINIEGGTLTGEGDIFVGSGPLTGAVRNFSGRIEPGQQIGTLNVFGDLTNLAAAAIAFDLAGTVPETDYDQINVDRFAFLAGTLEVVLSPGFSPVVGDSFELLTAVDGVVGEFDTLQLPAGFTWNVGYSANSLVLEVLHLGSPGDFNDDGNVNSADLAIWQNDFGNPYHGVKFLNWQRNYQGSAAAETQAVPEPGPLPLILLGLIFRPRLRRWR
ncbi:MAG: retropepsin-like domain-containing protein [Pirellulales bacterium]|nr:retropepsin-like domain-containing protein [Pirellulales bacterium]